MQHPDYPNIEFKPAIARYDWDQTYDVMEFSNLSLGLINTLLNNRGIPAEQVLAIDRYTPDSYAWADQYSIKLFNFLKNFNQYGSYHTEVVKFYPTNHSRFLNPVDKTQDFSWLNGTSFNINYPSIVEGDIICVYFGGKNIRFYEAIQDNPPSTLSVRPQDTYWVNSWLEINLNHPRVVIQDNNILLDGEIIGFYQPTLELENSKYSENVVIPVSLTKGTYCLTGLINEGYLEGLSDWIMTINKATRIFTLEEDSVVNFSSIINSWIKSEQVYGDNTPQFCSNSLVLSKQNSNGEFSVLDFETPITFLKYSDLDQNLLDIQQGIVGYEQLRINEITANLPKGYSGEWFNGSPSNTFGRLHPRAVAHCFCSFDYSYKYDLLLHPHQYLKQLTFNYGYLGSTTRLDIRELGDRDDANGFYYFDYRGTITLTCPYIENEIFTYDVVPEWWKTRYRLSIANNNKWFADVQQFSDIGWFSEKYDSLKNGITLPLKDILQDSELLEDSQFLDDSSNILADNSSIEALDHYQINSLNANHNSLNHIKNVTGFSFLYGAVTLGMRGLSASPPTPTYYESFIGEGITIKTYYRSKPRENAFNQGEQSYVEKISTLAKTNFTIQLLEETQPSNLSTQVELLANRHRIQTGGNFSAVPVVYKDDSLYPTYEDTATFELQFLSQTEWLKAYNTNAKTDTEIISDLQSLLNDLENDPTSTYYRIKQIHACLGGEDTQLFSTTQRPIFKNIKDISYALGLSYEKVEELNTETQEIEEQDKYINVRLNYPYPNHVPEEETN